MDREAGGLIQHPAGGAGGDDRVAGKDPTVGGTELKREFFAGIVCEDGDRHIHSLLFLMSEGGYAFLN